MLDQRVEEISTFCLNVSLQNGESTHTNAKTDIRFSFVCGIEVLGGMSANCTYWHVVT